MGQVLARIRQFFKYIISKFFSNGKRDGNNGKNEQAPRENKEVPERVITVPDDSYVISVKEDNPNEETAIADIEEQNQAIPVPDDVFAAANICKTDPEIAERKPPLQSEEKWIKHYRNSHKILLVGEGDFSFSACLAKAFGSAVNMTATSLDSKMFLEKNYKRSMSNINDLKNRGCTVIHNLDATEMVNHPQLNGRKFDRIVYNFPLAGFFNGYSRNYQLERNRDLIRLFMENAKEMIAEDGEIHITHKSCGFFFEWKLEDLASDNDLRLVEDVQFTLSDYPGYRTKYGFGGDNNFNCHGSRTYKFGLNKICF